MLKKKYLISYIRSTLFFTETYFLFKKLNMNKKRYLNILDVHVTASDFNAFLQNIGKVGINEMRY